MSKLERKNFEKADERRTIKKGKLDVIKLGDGTAMRAEFEPGWRWSDSVKQMAGTDSCEVAHIIYVISGRMAVLMNDGSQTELSAGDVGLIPPGHDAWVVGKEKFVGLDFQGGALYGRYQDRA